VTFDGRVLVIGLGSVARCTIPLLFTELPVHPTRYTVIDFADVSNSFFYNWSELALSPLEWFRFGLVIQRTRVFQTARDVQRGLLAGLSYKEASLTTYVFNPDDSKPIVVVALAWSFEP